MCLTLDRYEPNSTFETSDLAPNMKLVLTRHDLPVSYISVDFEVTHQLLINTQHSSHDGGRRDL